MIVCICKNVSSTMIENVIDDGALTVDAVRQQTGVAECCGKCRIKVHSLLNDRQNALDLAELACVN